MTRQPARDRILNVADRLLYSKGIRAVGIDEIIAEAGIAKASLYRHFESKDDLICEYLNVRRNRISALLRSRIEGADGAERSVDALFDALGEIVTNTEFKGCAFVAAIAEYGDSERVVAIVREYKQFVRDCFFKAVSDLPEAHRDHVAECMVYLFDGVLVHARVRPEVDTVAHARRCAHDLINAHRLA